MRCVGRWGLGLGWCSVSYLLGQAWGGGGGGWQDYSVGCFCRSLASSLARGSRAPLFCFYQQQGSRIGPRVQASITRTRQTTGPWIAVSRQEQDSRGVGVGTADLPPRPSPPGPSPAPQPRGPGPHATPHSCHRQGLAHSHLPGDLTWDTLLRKQWLHHRHFLVAGAVRDTSHSWSQ